MALNIVILAAGQGKRMNSSIPKVLHKLAGREMLFHIIDNCNKLNPQKIIIVYGHLGNQVVEAVQSNYKTDNIIFVEQSEQLGTAHAIKTTLPYLDSDASVLVLCGDTPLIQLETLSNIVKLGTTNNLILLTTKLDNPVGYGRIIRDNNHQVLKIVEDKDATSEQRSIKEVNSAIYLFNSKYLTALIPLIDNNNHQQEFYLTDIIDLAIKNNITITPLLVDCNQVMGVNNKLQLEFAERLYQEKIANQLLEKGLGLSDKKRIDIRGNLLFGKDCFIDINCIFIGNVTLGDNVKIMANCIIKDSIIASDSQIKANSIIENAKISHNVFVGPFARVRPDTNIEAHSHIGNFVEIKKSNIGHHSKVNHLTYIGDCDIGHTVNIGAGSVTCNYDGINKHKTIIGDNVFVGSGSMLVAPVELGSGAIIGAGSVITKDTPKDELTVARAKQITVVGWKKKYRDNN
jgi:bifunctional UDP-N-acetylglucosamine pyrophosphorylase/glucosamine-1-phosphate N-acetyltransferase